MVNKKLSRALKERHAQARKRRELFEELTGKKGEYRDFFQSKDIIRENIVVYDVSLQVSYSSGNNALKMDMPITYKVYALRDSMTDEMVYQETVNALINAKSVGSNEKVNDSTVSKVISNRTYNNVEVQPIRGMEISDSEVREEIIQKLKTTGTRLYVEEGQKKFTYKNKKGNTSDMTLDLSQYFNR